MCLIKWPVSVNVCMYVCMYVYIYIYKKSDLILLSYLFSHFSDKNRKLLVPLQEN